MISKSRSQLNKHSLLSVGEGAHNLPALATGSVPAHLPGSCQSDPFPSAPLPQLPAVSSDCGKGVGNGSPLLQGAPHNLLPGDSRERAGPMWGGRGSPHSASGQVQLGAAMRCGLAVAAVGRDTPEPFSHSSPGQAALQHCSAEVDVMTHTPEPFPHSHPHPQPNSGALQPRGCRCCKRDPGLLFPQYRMGLGQL